MGYPSKFIANSSGSMAVKLCLVLASSTVAAIFAVSFLGRELSIPIKLVLSGSIIALGIGLFLYREIFSDPYQMAVRCPFIDQDSVRIFALSDDTNERLHTIRAAVAWLKVQDNRSSAITLKLPAAASACGSVEDLPPLLWPYQAELLAVELDSILHPFLPYQSEAFTESEIQSKKINGDYIAYCADFFVRTIKELGVRFPRNLSELSVLLELLCGTDSKGSTNSLILKGDGIAHVQISKDGIRFPHLYKDLKRDRLNATLIHLVTGPYYPRNFWRHSTELCIVVLREAAVSSVKPELASRARERMQAMHKRFGIKVNEAETGIRPGLWIPERESKVAKSKMS